MARAPWFVLAASTAVLLASCSGAPPPAPAPTPAPLPTTKAPEKVSCAEGAGDCDGDAANACETSLLTSAAHCGACGVTCGAWETCRSGSCRPRRTLAAAFWQACQVTEDGSARCWGNNAFGAILPSGPKTSVLLPTRIEGLGRVEAIDTGMYATCALLATGKVRCWGAGKSADAPLPADVVDIAVSKENLCAVTASGSLKCTHLAFHRGTFEPATDVPKLTDLVAVSGGWVHSCALHKSGEVTCWGASNMLGAGEPDPNESYADSIHQVARAQGLSDAVKIEADEMLTCALHKSGRVSCWGYNLRRRLGDGSAEYLYSPTPIGSITDAVDVAVGQQHVCVVRATGEVACFGSNYNGELGDGGRSDSRSPVTVKGLSDAVAVTAGGGVTCAQRKTGAVSCWGSAVRGALGNGTTENFTRPMPVPGVSGATMIVTGPGHSCALDNKGVLTCWGTGDEDRDDARRGKSAGLPPQSIGGGREIVKIFGQEDIVCAVPKSGDPFCFNGHRNADDPAVGHPFVAAGIGAVKEIYATGKAYTNTAILASGQVVLWGEDPSAPGKVVTRKIPGLTDAVTLSATPERLCAVRASGKVACVGFNASQTFAGKDSIRPSALVEIPGLTDAVAIADQGAEYCIARKTGEVGCFSPWGRIPVPAAKNEKPSAKKPSPIELTPLAGISDAVTANGSAGGHCSLLKSGEVGCVGNNTHGQLGTGDFDYNKDRGNKVVGLTDAVALSMNTFHACAIRRGGEVVCWGSNSSQQVGQPDPPRQLTPTPIRDAAP